MIFGVFGRKKKEEEGRRRKKKEEEEGRSGDQRRFNVGFRQKSFFELYITSGRTVNGQLKIPKVTTPPMEPR